MIFRLYLLFFTGVLLIFSSCYVSSNPLRSEIKKLQKGKLKDESSFVYSLPYEQNKRYLIVQGYFGQFTHRERAALDFKMREGTKIFAARGGVVIRMKEDGDKGGRKRNYRQYGNYIVIQHADSSRTGYWHLQQNGALVNVGDTVVQNQHIAYSGNTGYTAFPHLHFIAWRYNEKREWQQMATRFATKKGAKYLRAWRRYRKPS